MTIVAVLDPRPPFSRDNAVIKLTTHTCSDRADVHQRRARAGEAPASKVLQRARKPDLFISILEQVGRRGGKFGDGGPYRSPARCLGGQARLRVSCGTRRVRGGRRAAETRLLLPVQRRNPTKPTTSVLQTAGSTVLSPPRAPLTHALTHSLGRARACLQSRSVAARPLRQTPSASMCAAWRQLGGFR